MKHVNFTAMYNAIKEQEINTLNEALENIPEDEYCGYPAGEIHFTDSPYVTCYPYNNEVSSYLPVMAMKHPVTSDGGILVRDEDDTIEIGYSDLTFGQIDFLLDCLPEE